MIATSKTHSIRRDRALPAVDDPRRSYDRGVWTGSESGADAPDGAPHDMAHELASVSIEALRRELDRRQKSLAALFGKRTALAGELAELDSQIAALQAADRSPRRPAAGRSQSARLALPRLKNSISLPDAVALEAELGQVVTPPEISKRVLASGYQTTSRTFTAMVTNALSNDQRFKRVGRGRYERV